MIILKQLLHNSCPNFCTSTWYRNTMVCNTHKCEWVSLRLSDLIIIAHLFLEEILALFRLGVNIFHGWSYQKWTAEAAVQSWYFYVSWCISTDHMRLRFISSSVPNLPKATGCPFKSKPTTLANTKTQRECLHSVIGQYFLIKSSGVQTDPKPLLTLASGCSRVHFVLITLHGLLTITNNHRNEKRKVTN